MRNTLACILLFVFNSFSNADENYIPVEGMEKELYVWAFPNAKDKEVSDLFVYSKRELVGVWVNACDGVKEATSVSVSNSKEKLYAYRFPGTVKPEDVSSLSLIAYDYSSKTLIRAKFNAEEREDGIRYGVSSYEYTKESPRHVGFDVRLVETSAGSKKYYVNLYTLMAPEFVNAKDGKYWSGAVNSLGSSNKMEKVYRLAKTIEKKAGQEIEVRGKFHDGSAFVQKFVIESQGESGELVLGAGQKTVLTKQEILKQELEDPTLHAQERVKKIYGGAQYSAQEVAQARAEHMNTMGINDAFHIDWNGGSTKLLNGMIPTANGQMWEGTSWGGGNTCSPPGGGRLVAEGRSGPFLVRFFQ